MTSSKAYIYQLPVDKEFMEIERLNNSENIFDYSQYHGKYTCENPYNFNNMIDHYTPENNLMCRDYDYDYYFDYYFSIVAFFYLLIFAYINKKYFTIEKIMKIGNIITIFFILYFRRIKSVFDIYHIIFSCIYIDEAKTYLSAICKLLYCFLRYVGNIIFITILTIGVVYLFEGIHI